MNTRPQPQPGNQTAGYMQMLRNRWSATEPCQPHIPRPAERRGAPRATSTLAQAGKKKRGVAWW
jgi:hypothetical protein